MKLNHQNGESTKSAEALSVNSLKATPTASDLNEPFSLSPSQKRFAHLTRIGPDAHLSAIISIVMRLRGDIDLDTLVASFRDLQMNQESLRLRVDLGQEQQWVSDADLAELVFQDYRDVPSEDRWTVVREEIGSESRKIFEMQGQHLLRAKGFILSEREVAVVLSVHHMVCDGFGIFALLDYWCALYSKSRGQSLDLPFVPSYRELLKSYRPWLEKSVAPHVKTNLLPLYDQPLHLLAIDKLTAYAQNLGCPVETRQHTESVFLGCRVGNELGPNPLKALKRLAQSKGSTLFMTLFAAWRGLLAHGTDYNDFCLAIPMAARGYPGMDQLVANCVNLLPIQCSVGPKMTFAQLLDQVKSFMIAIYGVMDYPTEELLKDLRRLGKLQGSDESGLPWNSTFNLEPAQKMPKFEQVPVQLVSFPVASSEFPLMINITEVTGFLRIDIDVQISIIAPELAELLIHQYKVILDRLGSTDGNLTIQELYSDLPTWQNKGDPKWRKKQIAPGGR